LSLHLGEIKEKFGNAENNKKPSNIKNGKSALGGVSFIPDTKADDA
jgi:hypothetical protein